MFTKSQLEVKSFVQVHSDVYKNQECTGNPYMLLCFLFKIATVLDFDISKDVSMNFQLTSSRTAICLSLFFWSLRQWLVVLELLTN
jgi:hypothetical protein